MHAAALFLQLLAGWAVLAFVCHTISKIGLGDGTFIVIALNIIIDVRRRVGASSDSGDGMRDGVKEPGHLSSGSPHSTG